MQIKQQRKHAMRKLPFGKGGSEQGYPARRDKGPYKPSPPDTERPIHGPKSEPSKDDPFGHQDALVGVKPGSKDWPSGIGPEYRRPDESRVKRGIETGIPSAAAKAMFTGPGGSESPASKLKRDRERFNKLKPTPGGGDLRVTEDQVSDTGVRTKKLKNGTATTSAGGTTYRSATGQQTKHVSPRIGGVRTTTRPSVAAGPGPRGVTKTRDYRGKLRGANVNVTVGPGGKGKSITAQSKDVKVSATPKQATVKVGPASVTRKIAREDMSFKDFVNQIQERKLTPTELKRREEIAKDLSDADFKQRYGDRWKEVKMGTATKMAKNES